MRPYRDYLTPALHRRFNKASRYTLLLCYAIACWMGDWDNCTQSHLRALQHTNKPQYYGYGFLSGPRAYARSLSSFPRL